MSKKEKKVKKEKKKKSKKIWKFVGIILLILILFIAGFVGYSVYKNGWGVKGIIQTAVGQDEEKLADLDPFTVLILGVSEDITSKLTDTIIVASYNPKNQKATLISIPRDSFVGDNKAKATSYDKINAIYQKGPEKTIDAVEKLTGLDITYYVVVSNKALRDLVDAIGGVEFDVPIDMNYDDCTQNLAIHLKAGPQRLNGEQAEGLVRFRKNNNGTSYPASYGDNDLGRMKTQREFIKEVAKQTIQLKNITKLKSFIDIFKDNVITNINNWSMIKDYIPYMVGFNTENVETLSVPGDAGYYGPYNLSFFIVDTKETKKKVAELFDKQNQVEEETEDSEESNNTVKNSEVSKKTETNTVSSKSDNTTDKSKSNIKIEVLNGSEESSNLTKVTNKLKEEGYNVYKTGTTSATSKTTIVNKTAVESSTTNDIKQLLGVGNISSSTSSYNQVDVTIIIGKDYNK